MNGLRLRSVLMGAILGITFAMAGRAEAQEAPPVSKQALQAKIDYCKTCHGVSGQGFRGAFPMPCTILPLANSKAS
jgi:cytochrome c553